jgi:hypothetical protein
MMPPLKLNLLLYFLAYVALCHGADKKEFSAKRVDVGPRIDGKLDESVWDELQPVHFIQTQPKSGEPSPYQTAVQILYTDRSIYIGARLYDPEPSKILKEFGQRDQGDRNADYFGVVFDTYNSGQNGFAFLVSAAGVQTDIYFTADNDDDNWDAVWKSEISFTEDGWIVEMEIPYFSLRFPKQQVQTWGVNFYRKVQRDQEESFWNHVDNAVRGLVNQSGILHGLENIKPPLRLSFSPYVTSIFTHDGFADRGKLSFAGGMDLKYGINESYTLDMSLIPDFSQVQSDNIVYNISAFEVQFNENRQFFTEGTELFNKANLFYSRRIGQTFGRVNYDPETEAVVSRPTAANLINATKISGRGKKGLGLGFFNAITAETFATVRNMENGETRQALVDPLTNFNVLVVDQNLKNNSNINFTNTSVLRVGNGRDANVTGLNMSLRDKNNFYRLSARGSVSNIFEMVDGEKSTDTGYKYFIELAKISGTWQYGLNRNVESDNYRINDLGFLRAPNEISHFGYFGYRMFKPVGIFNRINATLNVSQQGLYKPETFTLFQFFFNANTQFKNFWSVGFNTGITPITGYDYFEPRVAGRYYLQLPSHNFNFWIESDSRKPLLLNAYSGRWARPEWNQNFDWWGVYARYRVNDKLSFSAEVNYETGERNRGFVNKLYDENNELTDIIFGQRELITSTNIVGVNYTFNNKMGLTLRLRHYWSRVNYTHFYSLGQDGDMYPTDYTGLDENGKPLHHANFNAVNIDFVYFLQLAPGSFLNLVWKGSIQSFTNDTRHGYFESLGRATSDPQVNSISLRLTYFIDYMSLKKSLVKG